MKKYNFFKAICLPCIILSTISCGNEDYFIETSELQLNAMPFAEANIDTIMILLMEAIQVIGLINVYIG